MNTTVFVRFVFESPYINSFITHYKNLGFTNIIILFHDTFLLKDRKYKTIMDKAKIDLDNSKLIKNQLIRDNYLESKYLNDANIIFHPVHNYKNMLYSMFRKILPTSINWLLVVDSDEFLIINNKYKNILELINDATKNCPQIQCFQFKWVWITNAFKSKEETINNIILNHDCYENIKTSNLRYNIKTMYKYNPKIQFGNHYSNDVTYPKYVITTYIKNNDDYENNINLLKKCSINSNTLGFLLHIRIRSFHNLIFKTFNNYGISSKNKARKNGDLFEYFTNKKHKKIQPSRCLTRLYDYKVFEYEKRHINNIKSLKILYSNNFNNCLSYDTLFTIKEKEQEYFIKWINKIHRKLCKNKQEVFIHNVKFYSKMFETVNNIKNNELNFLVK